MKKRTWVLIIAFVAILAFLAYRYRSKGSKAEAEFSEDCIKVPSTFKKWGQFAQTNWGTYAKSLKKHLGVEKTDQERRDLVAGFFKAIDVEPRSEYVKYYRKYIRVWLKSIDSLPHWDIEKGYLRCK